MTIMEVKRSSLNCIYKLDQMLSHAVTGPSVVLFRDSHWCKCRTVL